MSYEFQDVMPRLYFIDFDEPELLKRLREERRLAGEHHWADAVAQANVNSLEAAEFEDMNAQDMNAQDMNTKKDWVTYAEELDKAVSQHWSPEVAKERQAAAEIQRFGPQFDSFIDKVERDQMSSNREIDQFVGGLDKGIAHLVIGAATTLADPVDAARGILEMAEHIPLGNIPNPIKVMHGAYDVVINGQNINAVIDPIINGMLGLPSRDDAQFWAHLGEEASHPYLQAIHDGKPSEAVGRAVFDIGSLLITDGAEAATKLGAEAATKLGAEAATKLGAEAATKLGAEAATSKLSFGFHNEISPAGSNSALQNIVLSQADYQAALNLTHPADFLNPLAMAVDGVGQRAAQRAVGNPAFVQAYQDGNWTLAGTLFHSAAAVEARALPAGALPAGWSIEAESVIQAGRGGSRVDVLLHGPSGAVVEYDWKTTGRSALSHGSRTQMSRHADQITTNIGGTLTTQESRSWVDFVRPLLPTVK